MYKTGTGTMGRGNGTGTLGRVCGDLGLRDARTSNIGGRGR